ncbi:MAG: rhodanese-like domain-containing protein [Bacteroidetes bacterium]|nr:rhodanese-like domain-containing protein [Bacteroidota bacterium]
MRKSIFWSVLFLSWAFVSCGQVKSTTFKTTIDNLLDETVDTIGVARLAELMQNNESIVLLDARELKEFQVSHIEGAKYVGYEKFDAENLPKVDSHQTVVVYCSIGYRSEKIGEKLDSLGYQNVLNLYGGIFEWVNQGHEVVDAKSTTENIHGFDKWWSKFITRGKVVVD